MVIQTNELDICAGQYVDIPHELWSDVGLWIHKIRVISPELRLHLCPELLTMDQDQVKPRRRLLLVDR